MPGHTEFRVRTHSLLRMSLLLVGRGPVATVLSGLIRPGVGVGVLSRGTERSVRLLSARSGAPDTESGRAFPAFSWDEALAHGRWDAIVCAAPLSPGAIRELAAAAPDAPFALTSHTPSEVRTFRSLVRRGGWALATPGFLATQGQPVTWWQPGGARVALAGPGSRAISTFFLPRAVSEVQLTETRALVRAATTVPFAAALDVVRGDWAELLRWDLPRRAANEARITLCPSARRRPLRRLPTRAALSMLPRLAGFPADAALRAHVGSRRAQSLRMLDDWIALGEAGGTGVAALRELREHLAPSARRPRHSAEPKGH